eukprot:CAMPEP_0198211876 /NCGR_PEP_ID=MMETSP1445-20131203/25394_1 /TAXON_ID=36898 /ORGANISM="Pyramimonas sp., Strain CCMP2087" /LENGTH=443 /DNA_ID=CAMNT_0043886227 /DNA_START=137 /DNA_END=1464 /DNA_ORIENTATION=-
MGSRENDTKESQAQPKRHKLVGADNFKRHNPFSDKFKVHGFHHLDFWCADASNTYRRFAHGLGMQLVAKTDQSTGNHTFASYVVRSNSVMFAFSAPYSSKVENTGSSALPHYNQEEARQFIGKHGLAVRAVGILVDDARKAYEVTTANGGVGVTKPHVLEHRGEEGGSVTLSEVHLYGEVVLRFVSMHGYDGPFLPNYEPEKSSSYELFGIQRMDHVVGNVHDLLEAVDYVTHMTGFHEFAEFVAEDVGTLDSGLNSMVLACDNEAVLLPINEPTHGTPRKSQIQTYLDQNEGPGVQHIALKTDDIFSTLRRMRERSGCGGFDFMPRPSDGYYERLPERVGKDTLTEAQFKECKELGILVDRDDQGVLLQIFTKPLGDRPTIFIEIIQRVGCMNPSVEDKKKLGQTPGCGGFGKGNFSELFKSIEDYEKQLEGSAAPPAAVEA